MNWVEALQKVYLILVENSCIMQQCIGSWANSFCLPFYSYHHHPSTLILFLLTFTSSTTCTSVQPPHGHCQDPSLLLPPYHQLRQTFHFSFLPLHIHHQLMVRDIWDNTNGKNQAKFDFTGRLVQNFQSHCLTWFTSLGHSTLYTYEPEYFVPIT